MGGPRSEVGSLSDAQLIAWDSPSKHAWHEVASAQVLNSKYVGLYFGARWCQPCHRFMAKLKVLYPYQKLEVVYVSLDRSNEEFEAYFREMPWLAVHPETRSTTGRALASAHGVMAIPAFVVYTPGGQVLTRNGVAALQQDPVGQQFPDGWVKVGSGFPQMPMVILVVLVILAIIAYIVRM